MRTWIYSLALGILLPQAWAGCALSGTLRDRGLHRAWRVERDCRHPERPATLVEIPWPVEAERALAAAVPPADRIALVRAGSQVLVSFGNASGEGRLLGVALTSGAAGERIAVRVRFGAATLHGIVRGPGWVELAPRKAGF